MSRLGAAIILLSFMGVERASAFAWYCPPVPELDGASGATAIALLLSVGAVLMGKAKR